MRRTRTTYTTTRPGAAATIGCYLAVLAFFAVAGGFAAEYTLEKWIAYFKGEFINVPFWACVILGVFTGPVLIPAAIEFQRATRRKRPARVCYLGPTGSGKSMTGLLTMKGLMQGEKFAAIDTERGSLSLYSDEANFDVLELFPHSPENYVKAIHAARDAGYKGLMIDSLTHAWTGVEGALEQVDKAAKRNSGGNSFAGWRDVTPQHNALVDAILSFPGHVVITMRVKMAYELVENSRGKKEPQKIGLQPIQRDGIEYEFDVVADVNMDHELIVGKTRCKKLDGWISKKAGADIAKVLLEWLNSGAENAPGVDSKPLETAQVSDAPAEGQLAKYKAMLDKAVSKGLPEDLVKMLWTREAEYLKTPPNPQTMAAHSFNTCFESVCAQVRDALYAQAAAATAATTPVEEPATL